jgi:hypothetical protein
MRVFSVGYLTTLSVASGDGTTDKLERIWKEAVVAKTRYYLGICLVGLRRATKTLNQNSQ